MRAFTRESARGAPGGGRRREGRGGDRSVRSSFERGGLRIRIVRRVRESRACAFSREEACRVALQHIYTNERARNRGERERERLVAVFDRRTNEASSRSKLASDDSGVDSHGYRDATDEVVPRIEGIRGRWRSRPVERSRSCLRGGTRRGGSTEGPAERLISWRCRTRAEER